MSSDIDLPLHDRVFERIEDWVDACIAIVKAPRFRRLILALVVLISTSVLFWVKIIQPWIAEEKAAWASLNGDLAKPSGLFGTNLRPNFPGMIQLAEMDTKLLPSHINTARRLIFIGDIHGCKEELLALMEKVRFNPETDHLVAVGDVVNKGPDTPGVIDYLRTHNASSVRGNHEDTLLLMANNAMGSHLLSHNGKGTHHVGTPLDKDPMTKLIRQLRPEQISWLRSLPIILKIGPIPNIGDVVVVHGGLVPGVPLNSQDPVSVMNMRTIDLKTHVPSKLHEHKGGIPWFRLWNRYEKLLPSSPKWKQFLGQKGQKDEKHTLVVYGHDAKKGLQINKWTKGLDSSCVKGGQLTALVINSQGKQEIVQIDCVGYTKEGEKKQKTTDG